jgi:hypothetical protein
MGSVASEIPIKSAGEHIGVCFANDNLLITAGREAVLGQEFHALTALATPTEAENLSDTPFYARVLHGFFLAVATCLPWNRYRVKERSDSKNFGHKGRLADWMSS